MCKEKKDLESQRQERVQTIKAQIERGEYSCCTMELATILAQCLESGPTSFDLAS